MNMTLLIGAKANTSHYFRTKYKILKHVPAADLSLMSHYSLLFNINLCVRLT